VSTTLPPAVRAAVTLLAMGGFFSGAALRICDGLVPRLAADFLVTPGVAGSVVVTFSVFYGLSQLIFGPLGDRYGKARMVCIALFGCAGGALVCSFAPAFLPLVILRGLWGVAAAGIIPVSLAWIGDAVPYEQRQATLARFLLGTLSGMTAGQLAGGLFADSPLGWRGAFATLSVGYAVIAVLLLVRLRSIPGAAPVRTPGRFAFARQLASVLAIPWARVVLATAAAEGIFLLGPLAFLPAYLHQRFGITVSAAAAMMALYAVGGLVYAVIARQIVRRLGERRMVKIGGIVMGLGCLAWYAIPVAGWAAPVALVVGFGTYLFHNTLQTHGTQMAPEVRGTAMACFAFCLFVGQAIGASLAGFAYDHFGAAPLLLVPAVALPVVGWAFARALHRRALAQ
jgi:predicted MFS family arabinose efflux permease